MPPSPSLAKRSDMLIVAKDVSDLRAFTLAEVYDLFTLQEGQDFYGFLSEDFFPDGICCVWEEKGCYVAALRLQKWQDGWLLEGVQTHREHRRKGYARMLVTAALDALKMEKVYVHIVRDNIPSVALHQACGFHKILDHAVYLDGSVHIDADTYVYETPR